MRLQNLAIYLLVVVLYAVPQFAVAEVIRDFSALYEIGEDGSVVVTERIVYDFEDAARRGIFRTLETDHPQLASSFLKDRVVGIEVRSVQRDGVHEPYVTRSDSNEVEIKIGDADRTVSGPHTYQLSYVLRGALSYGPDGAELYWNVTGHNWPVVIEAARVEVRAPEGVLGTMQTCYEGLVGSVEQCTSRVTAPTTRVQFFAEQLTPGEGMTIGQEVNAARVDVAVVEEWQWLWILFPLALLLLIGCGVVVYRRVTIHKPAVPIIAQYEPYGDLLPMYTGVVFDGRLDHHDITAGIVYLAEQGFVKIKHVETKVLGLFKSGDYELTLLRATEEAPNTPLQALLQMIFSAPDKPTAFYGISISIGSAQPSAVAVGETVMLSALKENARLNALVISSLKNAFVAQLLAEGYVERSPTLGSLGRLGGMVLLCSIVLLSGFMLIVYGNPLVSIGIFVAPLFLVGFLFVQRLTRKGYEARYHLLGFKEFLSVTDKDRFDFHNGPKKSPELFMKYLPYAIALKVEDKWAKAFEGITIPSPDWYDAGTGGVFSATTFATDLSSFSSSFSAASGTSGSSGGGSSGGGGGGGGGGSW